ERTGSDRGIAEQHLRLGRALRDGTSAAALPLRIFAIVAHLDAARALLTTREEQRDLAALHLIASRAARSATAYERARHHATEGLALLGDAGWREAYALARDLSLERMEAEYLGGDVPASRRSFEAARARIVSLEDRVTLHIAWI